MKSEYLDKVDLENQIIDTVKDQTLHGLVGVVGDKSCLRRERQEYTIKRIPIKKMEHQGMM